MRDFSRYMVRNDITVREALIALNRLSDDVLVLFVLDEKERLVGTLTDGDIRRKLIEGVSITEKVSDVMNTRFHFVRKDELRVETIKQIKALGINLLPVLRNDNTIIEVYNLRKKKSVLPLDAILMAGGTFASFNRNDSQTVTEGRYEGYY